MPSAPLRPSCCLTWAHVVLVPLRSNPFQPRPPARLPAHPGQAAGALGAPVPAAEGVHGE